MRTKFSKFTLLAATALTFALASTAKADPIWFDPDGSGGPAGGFVGTTFDWKPGNTLIIESAVPVGASIPTAVSDYIAFQASLGQTATLTGYATLLFQANLGTIEVPGGGPANDYLNGSVGGTSFITAVAGYNAFIVQSGSNSQFFVDTAGATNFFNIYANTAGADDLAGTGFANGTLILNGSAIDTDFTSNFTVTGSADLDISVDCTPTAGWLNCGDGIKFNDIQRDLDQYNNGLLGDVTNDYPGVYSILGSGATAIKVVVNNTFGGYFGNLLNGTTLLFTNSSQIDPYNQAEPSACFNLTGSGAVCESGVPSVGLVNGLGNRIVAQADANTSFEGTAPVVPEPATMTLLGLGLLGSAAARRRQSKKVSQ